MCVYSVSEHTLHITILPSQCQKPSEKNLGFSWKLWHYTVYTAVTTPDVYTYTATVIHSLLMQGLLVMIRLAQLGGSFLSNNRGVCVPSPTLVQTALVQTAPSATRKFQKTRFVNYHNNSNSARVAHSARDELSLKLRCCAVLWEQVPESHPFLHKLYIPHSLHHL